MRKLFLLMAVALVAASCSFFEKDEVKTRTETTENGSGNGSGEDPGTTPGSTNQLSDALQGWRCLYYSRGTKTFDTTISFHYDENGRIDFYDERQIVYKTDGATILSDDTYKRVYHYTSATHCDFYNESIVGHPRTNWFNFDTEGRITEQYNPYDDNYRYHYNEAGQLVEIENSYQYEEAEDEQKYGSWKKSRVIEWNDEAPFFFYQKWTSGSQSVIRDKFNVMVSWAYTNPFRGMAIDPTVMSSGVFDMMGWWGKRSEYLIAGWYNDDTYVRVNLVTDKDQHITGMVTYDENYGFDTRREYTFTWKGEAPLLKRDGKPIIN